MGNGYKHRHFQYQQKLNNFHNKITFLPTLCSRTSIKDVAPPTLEAGRSDSFSRDPLSPKIGCMGQVNRNNKITGFPTISHNSNITNKLASTTKSSSSNSSGGGRNNNVKYFKLKRIFSAGIIIAVNNNNNNNSSSTSCAISSCRRGRRREVTTTERDVFTNIAEMDPPLPVIKRAPKPAAAADVDGGEGDGIKNNIWKRRSNGGNLKSLELQDIKIPRHQVEIQTV